MTPSRVARFKVRRIKANGRERERMKGLNEQLEVFVKQFLVFPYHKNYQKLKHYV